MQQTVDYLDPDVAYLLGMIMARGSFQTDGDIRRLVIQFPFRLDTMTTLPGSKLCVNREKELTLSLHAVCRRINELLEVSLDVQRLTHEVALKATFTKNTMSWRNLQLLCGHKASYREFEVPMVIADAPQDIVREFLRGIADTSAQPSAADNFRNVRHRIVLQFQHHNWILPLQVCSLLQLRLGVKVQHILWGHPNLRAPGGRSGWSKEHRLRVFAEDFVPVGFNFAFKQALFEELVEWNQAHGAGSSRFCNPKRKKVREHKPRHPQEGSEALPEQVRRHFNAAFKICLALGCKQGKRHPQMAMFEEEDEEADSQ